MTTQPLVQTNHGIAYPLVGLHRVDQDELVTENEPTKEEKQSHQKDRLGKATNSSRLFGLDEKK